ncbi:MAG: leucyl aminopeptidase family protein [Rhodospirillales bacterium]|nr:leucyl aminopeptidase family protein [Rhodospirillales bacterium]MCW8862417.1 leucyl aminopeptidase family protein [Rhodospirillales bacterium]MCW8953110.1 leucyl aminopeptidase family protein [Rhodospirillales bacterium]MCW8969855.1 leucyl aminopeptidase family protein [Rhodospirillales bacterium]MCW9001575.1 leucyl aminopeptidase family protein [Rhodospirillales bacterium]
MIEHLIEGGGDAVPLTTLAGRTALDAWLGRATPTERAWIASVGFSAKPGSLCLVPDSDGRLIRVLAGISGEEAVWDYGWLATALPQRAYRLDPAPEGEAANRAALGWVLGAYRFRRYKTDEADRLADLVWPEGCEKNTVRHTTESIALVRDLINTPAHDMGPEQLAAAAAEQAAAFGASCDIIVGEDLLKNGYPAIHAVGRAAAGEPRLIDLRWGDKNAPRVTLVGKGVCFDTGGLDLKPAAAMKLMKKDMGGAAHALGLGRMVMAAGLPVRLRVLIPAVENSVGGNAMRPLDVVHTRKGITVEIGHTDAEGRVILADALAEADTESPDVLIDMATLTGAARVALGADLPALFGNDDKLAEDILRHSKTESDPLWRLPLWAPYRKHIDSTVAGISNDSSSPYGGAITAALFLSEFVSPSTPWMHLDMMAWNTGSRPGRPEGGEAMGLRALFAMLAERFPA